MKKLNKLYEQKDTLIYAQEKKTLILTKLNLNSNKYFVIYIQ